MKKKTQTPKSVITEDRVFWGMVTNGARFPDLLATDRKVVEATRERMPRDLQAKVQIVRAYVTIHRFVDSRRGPARTKLSTVM